jgi:hypothetical protein
MYRPVTVRNKDYTAIYLQYAKKVDDGNTKSRL